MIRYSLNCRKGHEFEVWFRSSADYDDQKAHATINCPACGSSDVEKAIMAPSVSAGKGRRRDVPQRDTPGASPPDNGPALNLPDRGQMVEAAREYHNFVTSHADDVGDNFAEEARKIHFGEAPSRGIYGRATIDEANELHEDGIDIAPLPILPEDHN